LAAGGFSGGVAGAGRARRGYWRGLAAQNLEHHGAAGRAFAFDGFAPVLHCLLDRIDNLLLGLAFDAVSFRHKNFTAAMLHASRQLLEIA
jgi:hypothetical protein